MRNLQNLLLALPVLLALSSPARADLKDYVQKADPTYAYKIVDTKKIGTSTVEAIELTSQTWHNIAWKHWLMVIVPAEVTHKDKAMLFITGGSNQATPPGTDSAEAKVIALAAERTKSIMAILTQVPNEPLFNGLEEDGIIAYTYDKFLKGEGYDWPLLFPMVKSAVRAMDTVQAVAKDKYKQDLKGFVVSGASKRGWTTWLTAATDPRVVAIAPIVIDVLNMVPQMKHQMEVYGGYSNEVQEYTDMHLQERMASPAGLKLLNMVDPYAYKAKLTLPKLIVLGTNDPYWTVDASSYYFPDLPGEKHLYYQANTKHDSNIDGISTITQFYADILNGKPFPEVTWSKTPDNTLKVSWKGDGGKAVLWQAHSKNRDFREATWTSTTLDGANSATAKLTAPEKGWDAWYVEVKFPGDIAPSYGSCTGMTVLPDTYPTEGRAYDKVKPASAK